MKSDFEEMVFWFLLTLMVMIMFSWFLQLLLHASVFRIDRIELHEERA